MFKKDQFQQFNGGFIKVGSIWQMNCLFVETDICACHGSINDKEYKQYVCGLSDVPYLDRPSGLLKLILEDDFCKDYLRLYTSFLEYNDLKANTICFDSYYTGRIFKVK